MSLTNSSQLILRNQDLLTANATLLVNMPADSLISALKDITSLKSLYCFDTNYSQHSAHKKMLPKGNCQFGAAPQNTENKFDLVILQFPKSKNELEFTLASLASELTPEARVLVVGDNKGGIKSIAKLGKNYLSYCDKVDNARHCLLFDVSIKPLQKPFDLTDWFNQYSLNINNIELKIAALPGVFSQSKLDVGTRVLLENLPSTYHGRLLDFGCGAGVIATYIAKTNKNIEPLLVDVSALALTSADKTLADNNITGKTIATDSLSKIEGVFDAVISNPPFHQGIKTNYAATEQFLSGISKHLSAKGKVTIVANSFLQYQPIMENSIAKTIKTTQQNGFSIYHATKN